MTGASAVQAVLELLQEQWNVDQEDHWWLASRRGALRMLEEELKLRVGDLVGELSIAMNRNPPGVSSLQCEGLRPPYSGKRASSRHSLRSASDDPGKPS